MKISLSLTACLIVTSFAMLVGCKSETSAPVAPESASVSPEEQSDTTEEIDHSVIGHGHGAGPHEGTIADWGGGKYHVEFLVDHGKTQATAYVLGSDEKTETPIDAETIDLSIEDPRLSITLTASPQESDPAGKSSRFVGTHEKLSVVNEYAGTLTGVIEGTPYSGDFEE